MKKHHRTPREIKRIQEEGSVLLRKLIIAYVYHSFNRSDDDKLKMYSIQNKRWLDECYKRNKHQNILNPNAFGNMAKNRSTVADIETVLGLKKLSLLQKLRKFITKSHSKKTNKLSTREADTLEHAEHKTRKTGTED